MDNQRKLNRRQQKFVDNIWAGMPDVEAYKAAGYNPRSDYDASSKARKLRQDDRVKAQIRRHAEESTAAAWKILEESVPRAREVLKDAKANSIQKRAARDILRRTGEPLK